MRSPRARAARDQAVISAGLRSVGIVRGAADVVTSVVALAGTRELPGPNVGGVSRERLAGRLAHLGVAPHETRLPGRLEPEQIVHHHDLPVAIGSRADA